MTGWGDRGWFWPATSHFHCECDVNFFDFDRDGALHVEWVLYVMYRGEEINVQK